MRAQGVIAAALAVLRPESLVRGSIVDAGALTTVTVEASSFEPGLVGELTRDGDTETSDSRWSCQPDDGVCSITYTLADPLSLVGLQIELYEGDLGTSLIDIYVDGDLYFSWTTSGTTSAFVEVTAIGREVELRSLERLSVYEVNILVNDDDLVEIEAGKLATVTATGVFFDPDFGTYECSPDECTAALTRDGEEWADTSKWSCSSALGGKCSISYDLGAVRYLTQLRLALYKGLERKRTLQVLVDDVLVTTWTSSGNTFGFEGIDLSGTSGQVVVVTGVLADLEWFGINETEIMVLWHGGTLPAVTTPAPSPETTPAPAPAPTPDIDAPTPAGGGPDLPTSPDPTAAPSSIPVEVGTVSAVTATATLYDQKLSADNGCEPFGCTAGLTRDGDMSPGSRWSCAPILGGDRGSCTISYDLGASFAIANLRLAMYEGANRTRTMTVRVDGAVATIWTSSGTTDSFETIDLPAGTSGVVVEITGMLADEEWLSIIETQIMVLVDEPSPTPTLVSPAPAALPSPSPTAGQPVMRAVGPLPLAWGRSYDYTNAWSIKDGDMSTSWTCAGDPRADEDALYDCSIVFNLFFYRHIKQVKIALADAAGLSTQMHISGYGKEAFNHKFVTDYGSTDGFETYDFDVFTNSVTIAGVFQSPGESISISEVEFIEEVQAGEVAVVDFDHPYATSSAFTTFDFSSNSDETTIDRTLSFDLATYAKLTAIELLFPPGETYKFELDVYNEGRDPFATLPGWESQDIEGWQSFDLTQSLSSDQYVVKVAIIMRGTGSGTPGFRLLDARFKGTPIDNPTNTLWVGSSRIRWWDADERYPDFVAEGTGDQRAINAAICAVKKASFDGVDCVGGDDTATGTVKMPMGEWFVDGSIVMKSGVVLDGRYSIDDSPYITDILLEEGHPDDNDISSIVVIDGVSDAKISDLFIRSAYDPESAVDTPTGAGLGPSCISITNSQNITLRDTDARFCDGDAMVVRNSQVINIDAGPYDDEYKPWTAGRSRGTGLVVDSSDHVWIRRHTVYDNGVAGIHITRSNNFTFEATIDDECQGDSWCLEGEGNVGSLDGQQPIEVIVESSTLVKFQDMKVQSANDPVMTVSDSSAVSFSNCGFSNVENGTCVILMDDLSDVTVGGDPELGLEGNCFVKV